MNRSIFFLLFFVPIIGFGQDRPVDVLHYTFHIELSDHSDTIKGRAVIRFVPTRSIQSMSLDLMQSTGKKGMQYIGFRTEKRLDPQLRIRPANNKLDLQFSSPLQKHDTTSIEIQYAGVPEDGLIISKNKHGKRTFFADNWPNRARHWLPCIDDPADKASVEFIVTAPSHYQVVSNGLQVEETNLPGNQKLSHWRETVPLPTKIMVIGVAEFAVADAGMAAPNIPVSTWVYPEDRVPGFHDFAIATDILNWYIRYIGPYPYKKLANVQSKTIFGGMENAGAIFYHENSTSGKREEESLIAHEIVHQWFGNMATEKSFAHLWLSEGFASYLTHVYLEEKYGTDSLAKRMQADRTGVLDFVRSKKRPVVDTTTNLMSLLNANSYQKGSWILHMLRRQLGDTVFRKSIRDYYSTYAGKNADTRDLQKIFEKNSGKDLSQFFKQWLYTPENLQLKVEWRYNVNKKKIEISITQNQEFVFQFPITIELLLASGKKIIHTIEVNNKTSTVEFPASAEVSSITIDPAVSLLWDGTVTRLNN